MYTYIYMCILPFERKDPRPRTTKLALLIYLFVSDFSPYSRNLHSYGDVTITGEGLQLLTYTQQSWS